MPKGSYPALFHTLLQISCDCCDLQFNQVNSYVRQEAVNCLQSILVNGLDAEVAEKEIAQMIRYSEDDFYHLKCVLEIMREQPGKFRSDEIAKQLRQVARRIVLETATPVQIQIADMLLRNADMVSVNDFQAVDQ